MVITMKSVAARCSGNCLFVFFLLIASLVFSGCGDSQGQLSLFNGKDLGNWQVTDFFRHGSVYAKDGYIILEAGAFLTGVTWDGPVVNMNYEISLEAMRLEGKDFFCGLTFPVNDSCCSLILSGWGGVHSGISSINGLDASSNETTRADTFENNRWYKVLVRVTPGRIRAWVDNKPFVDLDTTGKVISVRSEVIPSQPLGIASYQTTAAIRNISLIDFSEALQ